MIIGISFKLIHYWIYSNDGKGFLIFDLLGVVLINICKFSLVYFFVLIGKGWTVLN